MRTLIASSSLSLSLLAALVAASAALAQGGSPVCLKGISGMANCSFQTIAQCEAAKGMNTAAQCIARADANSGLTPARTTAVATTGQVGPRQPGAFPRPSSPR